VALFFGVADLDMDKRKRFMDKWLTRAQKMHYDDILLTRCKRRPIKLQEPKLTMKTAAQHERLSRLEGQDVTDAA